MNDVTNKRNPMEYGVSQERYEMLNQPGSLNELALRISLNEKDKEITYQDVVKNFPKFCTTKLRPASIDACRMYFLQQMSIIQIASFLNVSYSRIERRLKKAEEGLVEYLKEKREETENDQQV